MRFLLSLLAIAAYVVAHPLDEQPGSTLLLPRREDPDCRSKDRRDWEVTPENWKKYEVDKWLQIWWKAVLNGQTPPKVEEPSIVAASAPVGSLEPAVARPDENAVSRVKRLLAARAPAALAAGGGAAGAGTAGATFDGGKHTPPPAPELPAGGSKLDQEAINSGITLSLLRDYAPGYEDSFKCSLVTQCSIDTCENIRDDGEVEGGHQAYLVLSAISNMVDFYNFYFRGLDQAHLMAESLSSGLVKTFTLAGEPPKDTFGTREILNALQGILCAVFAFFPEFSLLWGVGLETLSKGAQLALKGTAANAGTPGAITAGISMSLVRSQDLTLDKLTTVGNWIASITNHAREGLGGDLTALLAGQKAANGAYIWDYLQGGSFTYPANPDNVTEISSYVQQQYVAGAINALWKNQFTYILAIESADCNAETRGPEETRFCVEGYPYAFYYYMLLDKGKPWPQIWAPYGHERLGDYFDLSMETAGISSVKAFFANKYAYEDVRLSRWLDAMAGTKDNSPVAQRARMEGVFTTPVCIDTSGGSLLSTLKRDKGRNYPCWCGQNGDDTPEFAAASGLSNHQGWKDWCFKGDLQAKLRRRDLGEEDTDHAPADWKYPTSYDYTTPV
ncbi:MAG: hypothetical protein M1833_006944 [Piccolia ochrophora]|nr:MAG: hypothetical protein M1833_006944 [Piccolia ochrophora]